MNLKLALSVLTIVGVSACTPLISNTPLNANSETTPPRTLGDGDRLGRILQKSQPHIGATHNFNSKQEVRPVQNSSDSFSDSYIFNKENQNESNTKISRREVISISSHNDPEITDPSDSYWANLVVLGLIGVTVFVAVKFNRS